MTHKTALTLPAVVLALFAGPIWAQDTSVDVNGDSMLSFSEVQMIVPDMTGDDFTALDTSGDGLLDSDEIAAAIEAGALPEMKI